MNIITSLDTKLWLRRLIVLFLFIVSILALTHCHKKNKSAVQILNQTIIAKKQTPVTQLFYNATIAPIRSQAIFSPIDARVNQVDFKYGETIKKGDILFALSSSELVDEYRKTVTTYLQSKQDYQNALVSFQGTKVLFKAQIVSKEEYENENAALQAKALAYNQAIYDLEKLLAKAGIPASQIEQLSLNNMDTVNNILNKQLGQVLIRAPVNGVALFPIAGQGQKAENPTGGEGKIQVGDEVKAGQLVLSIGDLAGFSVKFAVSEININQIKIKLPATVTGDAFPGIVLNGKVSAVTSQAKPTEGGGGGETTLSMFDVEVVIPKVTEEQREIIHIGMSAKVELDIKGTPQIMLPLNAIFTKNNQTMVTKLDEQGNQVDVPVVTGSTNLNQISIVSGIKEGDHILLKPQAPTPSQETES